MILHRAGGSDARDQSAIMTLLLILPNECVLGRLQADPRSTFSLHQSLLRPWTENYSSHEEQIAFRTTNSVTFTLRHVAGHFNEIVGIPAITAPGEARSPTNRTRQSLLEGLRQWIERDTGCTRGLCRGQRRCTSPMRAPTFGFWRLLHLLGMFSWTFRIALKHSIHT